MTLIADNKLKSRIGFMQGRLSTMVNGKIQAFPYENWENEFSLAKSNNYSLMEWTLDYEDPFINPLMTKVGRGKIKVLLETNNLKIPSLTGDCFMQAPFWKSTGEITSTLISDLYQIIENCGLLCIKNIVIPLVDGGRINHKYEEDFLVSTLLNSEPSLVDHGVKIIFESDFDPARFVKLMDRLDSPNFGINYDIGNSAALGFHPAEEIGMYWDRIFNVHVKDRLLGGTTVPLGCGDASFEKVFKALGQIGYQGNFILQTARALDERHLDVLNGYREFTLSKAKDYF